MVGTGLHVLTLLSLTLIMMFVINTPISSTKQIEPFQDSYEITEIPDILTPEECERLIAFAEQDLEDSRVAGSEASEKSSVRISKQRWLCADDLLQDILLKIRSKCAELTGVVDTQRYECLQVARYKSPTGHYAHHHDACVKRDLCTSRSRIFRQFTVLIYLNDDYTGGETDFPELNVRVKPARGKGVLFLNVDSSYGEHPLSRHAGLPVTSGTKYIANQWIDFDASLAAGHFTGT
eukprot:jgi/Astpho2/5789/fgenesh1_pg.00080_%23_48_t